MKQRSFVHRYHIPFDSPTSSCRRLIWFIHFLMFLITTTNALVKLPQNMTIPALLVFGDSIVDAGNNDEMLVAARCDYPPYGIDFEGAEYLLEDSPMGKCLLIFLVHLNLSFILDSFIKNYYYFLHKL